MGFMDKYRAEFEVYDRMDRDFIDDELIWAQLNRWENPSREDVRRVLRKAEGCVRLEPEETAILIQNQDEETIEEMFRLAHRLKEEVYGDRIVFFAPLYISDECANNCVYCGFRSSNRAIHRKTLTMEEIAEEVRIMIEEGQKRTVLVYGESPATDIDFICESVRQVYSVKNRNGEIRRANINCAPLTVDELRKLKGVGIGTFQVFQETYHHETYRRVHPQGTIKGHYRWRLYAMDRAQQAGVDDVGLGVLFGLYDWRFEVMGLIYHTIHLEETFGGVGPHTISFPRITPAIGTPYSEHPESRQRRDLKKLVAYRGCRALTRAHLHTRDRTAAARVVPSAFRRSMAAPASVLARTKRPGVRTSCPSRSSFPSATTGRWTTSCRRSAIWAACRPSAPPATAPDAPATTS